jgi:hypothetical protein
VGADECFAVVYKERLEEFLDCLLSVETDRVPRDMRRREIILNVE